MSQKTPGHRNLWSLTVLCLLRLRPMHPYELQRLIREWHKDDFLDLKRGSLYHAIDRLRNAGLIDPVETTREGRRPERTVYRLTEQGEREVRDWLRELLARPGRESMPFFAALSFLPVLTPEDAQAQLQERLSLLVSEIAGLSAALETMVPKIGRLPLLEVEYARAMREAEVAWVKALLKDLRSGRLRWDPQALRRQAARAAPGKPKSPACE
jgi:DNA-binding PadR family transcriptional regulator